VTASSASQGTLPQIDALPAWLELPPKPAVAPPIVTAAAELPIAELSWVDFERLCLQLARLESDVIGARLYGTAGQAQHGIDLYGRTAHSDEYRVYQCKQVASFDPSVIRDAVESFEAGDWVERTGELVLCTSDTLRTTQRTDEFERQRARLWEKGVRLEVWAREDISDRMRRLPLLVHDFFGRAWVERFCGPGAGELLGTRLGPQEVTELRRRLHQLYTSVFAAHDPGLVAAQPEVPLGLYERYVVPDTFLEGQLLEQELVEKMELTVDWFVRADIAPPFAIYVTLQLQGLYRLIRTHNRFHGDRPGFDREILSLPAFVLHEQPSDSGLAPRIKPLLDTLWQAAGWDASPYFDELGWTLAVRRRERVRDEPS
jgi:hypothetical protein